MKYVCFIKEKMYLAKNRFLKRYPFLYDTSLKKSNIKTTDQKDISKCPITIVILMPSKIGKVFSSLIGGIKKKGKKLYERLITQNFDFVKKRKK